MDADTIAMLCGVALSTAYRWKQYPDTMPTAAKRLVALVAGERVLPPSWRGWRFVGDELISPIGDAMNASQVEQWRLYADWWRQACREVELLKEYVDYLESITPRAEVIAFPRGESRQSATTGKEINPLFNKPD